jgi:hypothetical protein
MELSHDHCVLCGIRFDGCKRRFQECRDIRRFLRTRCKASPFVYQLLTESKSEGRRGICISCVNWKRRANGAGLKRARTPLLQLDQLIMFLMQPGSCPEPDRRCMGRLMRAIRQLDNPFRRALPLPVEGVVRRTEQDTFEHALVAWWEYNGKSEFFATAGEARRVRAAIKQGLVEDPHAE